MIGLHASCKKSSLRLPTAAQAVDKVNLLDRLPPEPHKPGTKTSVLSAGQRICQAIRISLASPGATSRLQAMTPRRLRRSFSVGAVVTAIAPP